MKRLPLGFRAVVLPAALGLLAFAAVRNASAQPAARGLGMGTAYTAAASGVHAADWNPANLGLPRNPKFSLSVFSVTAGASNNSFSLGFYNGYATDSYWDPEEVDALMARVPDEGLGADVLAEARILSFSVKRFAMSFGVRAAASVFVDRTVLSLPLEGTRVGQTYEFDEMDAGSLGLGFARLSYGAPVRVSFADTFAVGASVHMDVGGGYARVDSIDAALSIRPYGFDINGSYAATMAPIGRGWGMDLGAAAKFGKRWTAGLSLMHVAGAMKWTKDVKHAFGRVRGDSINALDFSDDEDVSQKEVTDTSWTEEGGTLRRKVPPELRLGVLYEEGHYCLTADYVQGFGNLGWVTTKPRLALGTEWRRVRWLPLRMGVVMGGRIGFGTSFGFGLRPGKFVLDFGVLNRGFLFPNSSKGTFLSVEMGVGL